MSPGGIRAPGSKQPSSSFASLMPTLPQRVTSGQAWSVSQPLVAEAKPCVIWESSFFVCECHGHVFIFHSWLVNEPSGIEFSVFKRGFLGPTKDCCKHSCFFFFFFLLLLLLFLSSCAIGRLFVFALFLSCNRFLQSVLSGWRFLSRVVVNVPQCCRPLFPHWGFLVWSVASLSRGIWILLAGLGLPSSSHRSHFAARCNAASSRSGSLVCLVCLVFGFVATLLTIAAWLFWFLHVFVFFLLAAWVFLKASCQRFAYLLFSLYFCFVAVCLTCLIEFMAALRRTYRNGQRERYIYII